jgi:hypothetical protein
VSPLTIDPKKSNSTAENAQSAKEEQGDGQAGAITRRVKSIPFLAIVVFFAAGHRFFPG